MRAERAAVLRIHGVSGGDPEELLDVESTKRVAGDGLAGFFRWRPPEDTRSLSGVPREIYTWGNLTSGRSSRALWLLLLPFMLVNIAYWMRPGHTSPQSPLASRMADGAYGTAVRLLALSLTALLTLAAAGVGMDLVAWQCGGAGRACAELRPWLGFLSRPDAPLATPGRSLAAGTVLPLAAVLLLWLLSRRTGSVYEVASADATPTHHATAPLSHPGFWRNSAVMGRLRSAHVAVALGTVAVLLLVPPLAHDLSRGAPAAGAGLACALAAALACCTGSVLVPGTDERWNRRADLACALLRTVVLVLLAGVLAYALWPRPGWEASGELPGHSTALNAVFAFQCVLGVVLFTAALLLHARHRTHDDIPLRGTAGPATAVLGALLGGVFSAAVVYQTAGWLGGCFPPSSGGEACLALRPPTAYAWLQLAFTLEAGIVLALSGVLAVVLAVRTRRERDVVAARYGRDRRARRTGEIARARAWGGLTEALPPCLVAVLSPAVALILLGVYAALTGQITATAFGAERVVSGPVSALARAGEGLQEAVTFLVTVGSWLGGLFLAVLAGLGRSAYQNRPTRRAVGMLWDVGTFWPRSAHPLAPPSYAERAVPQLTARVQHLAAHGTGVVLSGHSQGSVLAAAAVWQLPDECSRRVALLTHGSPLYRLYTRYFPACFHPGALASVADGVAQWRNLWRRTDSIGGPVRVRSGGRLSTVAVEAPLPDPRCYDVPAGEAVYPDVAGHSDYTGDPAYRDALAVCSALVAAPRPGSPAAVGAPDPAHGGPDVEEVDQGGDEGQEHEHPLSGEDGAQRDEGPHAEQDQP
ncbi:hypothetical protein FHX37_4320 [Haloactinospora alba]|uniref:Integral membrane protein n=1 Tax=Haloactinospora alba TaxID=405555 RepID=A0A543N6Y3_9ACTN|nr:hypothetical protein FHX37_4320 [Haloactinospora alba]